MVCSKGPAWEPRLPHVVSLVHISKAEPAFPLSHLLPAQEPSQRTGLSQPLGGCLTCQHHTEELPTPSHSDCYDSSICTKSFGLQTIITYSGNALKIQEPTPQPPVQRSVEDPLMSWNGHSDFCKPRKAGSPLKS